MDEPADNNQSSPQKQDIPSPQSQSPDDHSQPSSDSATVQDTAKANDNSTTSPTNNSATVTSALNDIWTKITTVSSSVMHSIDNQFHDVMDSMHAFQSRFRSHGGTEEYTGTWILGKKYEENQMEVMKKDIRSRPWFTYRHSFSPIKGTNFSTDTGWGCMLRSAQTLLAQALLLQTFGRDWTLEEITSSQSMIEKYINIMTAFLDHDDPKCPFSIHRIAGASARVDVEVGQWFGPTSIAQVLKSIAAKQAIFGLQIHVAQDAVVYNDQLSSLFEPIENGLNSRPVLLLVPLRLGIQKLNQIYIPMLKKCFELKWCVGIAGGRPSSALYFHGYSNSRLLHLDPHYPQPTISLKSIPYFSTSPSSDDQNEEADELFTLDDFKSYICSDIRSVNVADIDPSMVIGFYIPNAEEWDQFKTSWKEMSASMTTLFDILEKAPSFDNVGDDIMDMDDDDEDAE